MPAYAQDILFVVLVVGAFVLLLRAIARRLDRTRPGQHGARPGQAPDPEARDG